MEYIEFFGLKDHPFLLAPTPSMFYAFGQYYECIERLKYAIDTEKGGVLLVSEEPGLGKTTILLSLIEEMKHRYKENFRYAFFEYTFVSSSQIIGHIYSSVTSAEPSGDKLKDYESLRHSLIRTKEEGGRALIVFDEAHLLSEDILQELRLLLNLKERDTFLLTLVLSGQRSLWDRIKNMPEFFQRLPIRYYLMPLKLEETKDLVRWRLNKAGLEKGREIFKEEALEIIHRISGGIPRTILVLSDLSLLIGFRDRIKEIGFKEVSKAMNLLKGKGDSFSFAREEREQILKEDIKKRTEFAKNRTKKTEKYPIDFSRSIVYGLLFLLFAAFFFLKHSIFDKPVVFHDLPVVSHDLRLSRINPGATQSERKGIIFVNLANVRSRPSIDAPVMALLLKGEIFRIEEVAKDENGKRWFKIRLLKDKEGWISEDVSRVIGGEMD